jgi:hypothetical protein
MSGACLLGTTAGGRCAMSCGAEKSGPPHWEAAKLTSKLRTTKDSTFWGVQALRCRP